MAYMYLSRSSPILIGICVMRSIGCVIFTSCNKRYVNQRVFLKWKRRSAARTGVAALSMPARRPDARKSDSPKVLAASR